MATTTATTTLYVVGLAVIAAATAATTTPPLDCFFDTLNNTHITELPKTLTCKCSPGVQSLSSDNLTGIMEKFDRISSGRVDTVSIGGCKSLELDLDGGRGIDLIVRNATHLGLNVNRGNPVGQVINAPFKWCLR